MAQSVQQSHNRANDHVDKYCHPSTENNAVTSL